MADTTLQRVVHVDSMTVEPSSGYLTRYPNVWHDPENPNDRGPNGPHMSAFIDYARTRPQFWLAHGVPCRSVALPGAREPGLQPRSWVAREAELRGRDPLNEYIYMTRESPANSRKTASRAAPEVITVRNSDSVIQIYEQAGYRVWYAPPTRYDYCGNLKDNATQDKVKDVHSLDKPLNDVSYFFTDATIASASLGNWKPGQLVGPDGSDPLKINRSPSNADRENWKEGLSSETRSVTSIGHAIQHSRPLRVPVGWGDWDDFTTWQSYGRHVSKDMTENNTNWPRELDVCPTTLVKENGEPGMKVRNYVDPAVAMQVLGIGRYKEGQTVYEKLHSVRSY